MRLPHAETRAIRGPAGEIPLRVIRPKGDVRGVYLHIHGGGHVLGSEDMMDPALDALANRAGAVVVSVGYRLAPEHPYPAGPDDCEAAAVWLAANARREFGSERLAIGGESAGAHLCAVTLVRLRDRHGATPFCGANLVYGIYDLTFTPTVRNWGERILVLSTPIIEWFSNHFVPDKAKRGAPDVSPLYADLRRLPPALFTIGTLDPLLDDSLFMASRWSAAGNRAELAVYPGRRARLQPVPHAARRVREPPLPGLRGGPTLGGLSVQANEMRRGMNVMFDGRPFRVMEIEIRTPGKGRAFVQVKLRSILDGTQRELKLSTADQVDEAAIESKEMDYLYAEPDAAVFMDIQDYEQIHIANDVLGDARPWLAENMRCWVDLLDGIPISVTLPKIVEIKVRSAEATMKGQTAAKSSKPAVLENGVTIQVPPFVNAGDKLRVDPAESRYIERAK